MAIRVLSLYHAYPHRMALSIPDFDANTRLAWPKWHRASPRNFAYAQPELLLIESAKYCTSREDSSTQVLKYYGAYR